MGNERKIGASPFIVPSIPADFPPRAIASNRAWSSSSYSPAALPALPPAGLATQTALIVSCLVIRKSLSGKQKREDTVLKPN